MMKCKVDGQIYGGRALCQYFKQPGEKCTAPKYHQCDAKQPERKGDQNGNKRIS